MKRKTLGLLLTAIFIVGLVFSSWAMGAKETQAKEPVLIGLILERTGWGAVFAPDVRDWTYVVAKKINEAGGIFGRPIKIVEYDNESTVELTATYVNKLIEKDKVLAIIGPMFSGNCNAAIEAAKNKGTTLIYLSPGPNPPELSMPGSGIFAIGAPDWVYAQAGLLYLKKKYGAKSMAGMATTDDSGTEDLDYGLKAAEKYGLEVKLVERFDPNALDVTPQLAKIKAAKVDGIYLGGAGNAIGPLMKGIQLLGIDLPVVGCPGLTGKEMLDLMKGYEPDKLVLIAMMNQVPAFNVQPPNHPQMKIAEKYTNMIRSEYPNRTRDDILFGWGAISWDAMELVAEGLKQAGPLPKDLQAARSALISALENRITNFQQMWGPRTLSPTDHRGLEASDPLEMTMLTVRNGKVLALPSLK